MGIKEFLLGNPGVIQTTIIMGFGCIVWICAMREMLKKDKDVEVDKTVLMVEKKSTEHATGHGIQLTYITKKQIMDLTAEQVKGIPESEVEKLPTAMKDMFKRRRNEVLLQDRTKNSK
jgi:beta-lactamase regulating signal transducer with metallopeptidase domain